MKITVTEKTEKEIEVTFPLYGMFTNDIFVSVLSPNKYISVDKGNKYGCKIEVIEGLPVTTSRMIVNVMKRTITRQEFMTAYLEARGKIVDLFPELPYIPAPTLERNEPLY